MLPSGGGTIDGARELGFADKAGSLTPGKRADLILIRAADGNLAPIGEPYNALVQWRSRRMSTPSWSTAASCAAMASSPRSIRRR